MNEEVYHETFTKSFVLNNKDAIEYVIESIYKLYDPEKGWVVGEPKVTTNNDGKTVTISVELTKYPQQKEHSIFK